MRLRPVLARLPLTLPLILSAVLLLALLCGCLPKNKDWTHPLIGDPRREDRQFEKDTDFCRQKIGKPAAPENDPDLADCYRRLGWQPAP